MNLQRFLDKPDLWWLNGMGNHVAVDVRGYGECDAWSHLFGFQIIESRIDGATDGLLCLSKECYKTDIKFHANMNLIMIRCWGGGLAERPKFYRCCDIYGLLPVRIIDPHLVSSIFYDYKRVYMHATT
ncbi:hypothetical protein ACB092_02G018500 [Castanea dentata]